MPVGAIVGGVGSAVGGIASGKGASKAAKIQAQAAQQQTAALQAMYQNNVALMRPTYDNGAAAQARIQTLLGLSGGDGSDVQKTLESMPGYQFALRQSLGSANANAYASGMGNSGAAMKTLQDRANNLATQNYGLYFNQLGSVADRGVNAMNSLTNQGNNTTGQQNAVTQSAADSASANAVYQGTNWANVLSGLGKNAGDAYQSSYAAKKPSAPTPYAAPSYSGNVAVNALDPRFSVGGW